MSDVFLVGISLISIYIECYILALLAKVSCCVYLCIFGSVANIETEHNCISIIFAKLCVPFFYDCVFPNSFVYYICIITLYDQYA